MSDRILLLGAGGFIGQQLVRTLAQQGASVTAVSRHAVDDDLPGVHTVVAELREPADFAPLLAGHRAVVYLASTSTPGTSADRPMAEVVDNLQPLAGLLQSLQDHPDVHLLYLSSGGSLYAADTQVAADETAAVRPRSYHGAGKVAAEFFIRAWCSQYASGATILRPSNVYGPGQPERAGFGIVPTAFGKMQRHETLHVWGDGSAVRDYVYVDDLVTLAIAILAGPTPTGARIVNACSGTGVSLNELFRAMETVAGQPLQRSHDLSRAVDAARVVMDPGLARRLYSLPPATPLHEGLRRTWAWLNRTGG